MLTKLSTSDSGTYIFTTGEGCEISLEVEVTLMSGGSETNPDSILVYPNPVTDGKLKVMLRDFMGEPIEMVFFDVYGKKVLERNLPPDHSEEEVLDLSYLSSGVYILDIRLPGSGKSTLKKVMKIR